MNARTLARVKLAALGKLPDGAEGFGSKHAEIEPLALEVSPPRGFGTQRSHGDLVVTLEGEAVAVLVGGHPKHDQAAEIVSRFLEDLAAGPLHRCGVPSCPGLPWAPSGSQPHPCGGAAQPGDPRRLMPIGVVEWKRGDAILVAGVPATLGGAVVEDQDRDLVLYIRADFSTDEDAAQAQDALTGSPRGLENEAGEVWIDARVVQRAPR